MKRPLCFLLQWGQIILPDNDDLKRISLYAWIWDSWACVLPKSKQKFKYGCCVKAEEKLTEQRDCTSVYRATFGTEKKTRDCCSLRSRLRRAPPARVGVGLAARPCRSRSWPVCPASPAPPKHVLVSAALQLAPAAPLGAAPLATASCTGHTPAPRRPARLRCFWHVAPAPPLQELGCIFRVDQ
jgi:hypothetical protein